MSEEEEGFEEEEAEELEGEELIEATRPDDDDEDLGEALDDNDNNNEADLEEVAHDRDRPTKRRAYAFDELQELDEGGARGSAESVPFSVKGSRACLICGMIKTLDQFQEQGCDNCARLMTIREDKERVLSTTSSRVSGFIAMMDPSKSWVARYQRLQPSFVPGVYAVSVKGTLTEDVAEVLDEANYQYVSRDFFDRSLKK